tara:strand:- start:453 stop:980 length:528 start_codon:yes stop_codon:yes gene_type:complete
MNRINILIYTVSISLFFSCTARKNRNDVGNNKVTSEIEMDFSVGQPIIIYKTKVDYSQNVAVTLSDDKSKIISYPHPADVFYKKKLAYPIKLDNEYLLDNLGININTAYLGLTLKEYSQYKEAPSLIELYKLIIDKNPLIEFYNCGNRQNLTDELADINNIIKQGYLDKCKCLKK